MTFATAEARANASVSARLANATATFVLPASVAGQTVDGIFSAPDFSAALGPGVESASPEFAVNEPDLPAAVTAALDSGAAVSFTLRGDAYTVIEPKPDSTGWTVLRLRK
jgi:hypothetical protein